MTRALLIALALPFAAQADTCHYGNEGGTTATIQPHDEAFAEIIIDNKLAFRARHHCDMTLFGVTVSLEYAAGPGSDPDWFITAVPPGFRADPPNLLLDDGDTGSILIWHDGGLGS